MVCMGGEKMVCNGEEKMVCIDEDKMVCMGEEDTWVDVSRDQTVSSWGVMSLYKKRTQISKHWIKPD